MVSATTLSLVLNHLRHSLAQWEPLGALLSKLKPKGSLSSRASSSSCSSGPPAPCVLYASRFEPSSAAVSWSSSLPSMVNLSKPVTPGYVPPRAPIVLCHGLYGFDKRGPDALPFLQVRYWGGIEDALAKLGAKVVVARVPRTGSIRHRAHVLHAFLNTALHGHAVNFVAHSMGGLDCRYLLSHLHDRAYQPLSLTTISTPHRGSSLTNWFRQYGLAKMTEREPWVEMASASTSSAAAAAAMTSDAFRRFAHRYLDTPAYANLTTDFCQDYFNPNTPDDPNVAYYSYGSSVVLPLWAVLGLPNQLIREHEGDNDGIVSVKSAKWGEYIKTLNVHHWGLNGQRYPWFKSSHVSSSGEKFDTIDFYLELATNLYQRGH